MQRNHLVYHEQNPYICNKFDISCTFFALYRTVHKFGMPICQGSGCGSVGRAVTSNTRGCRLESNHRQNLLGTYLLSTVLKRRKRGRDWRIKNLFGPKMTHQNLWQKVFFGQWLCGSVDRAVASDIRGPWFESSHRQKLIYIEHLFPVNCVLKRRK